MISTAAAALPAGRREREALQAAIDELLAGTGVVVTVYSAVANWLPHAKSTPPSSTPGPGIDLRIEVDGYGMALQAERKIHDATVEMTVPLDDAIAITLVEQKQWLTDQISRAGLARSAGFDRPLTRDQQTKGDHLVIDQASARCLVEVAGDAGIAASWVREALALHAEEATAPDGGRGLRRDKTRDPQQRRLIQVEGATLCVPLVLDPLHLGGSNPAGRTHVPLLRDDRLDFDMAIPETIAAALVGRRVDALVAGTPVDERIITEVDVDRGEIPVSVVLFEPRHVPLWEALR